MSQRAKFFSASSGKISKERVIQDTYLFSILIRCKSTLRSTLEEPSSNMANNIHTLGRGGTDGFISELKRTLWNIPPVTRYLISAVIVVKMLTRLSATSNHYVYYDFREVFKHVQIWRPFTSSLVLHPEPMPAMLELYTLYSRSSQLEVRRQSLDYVFYMFFCITVISLMVPFVYGTHNPVVLTSGFMTCLTYTWSLDNMNVNVMVYGLFPIRGKYFPLVQLLIDLLFLSQWFPITVMGFLTAYLYACLDTGTLGPLYGWSTGASEYYGIHPNGKFGAPQWLHRLLQASRNRSSLASAGSGGRKLGFKDQSTMGSTSTASGNTRKSSTTAQRRPKAAVFPGTGQRLGN